MYRPRMYKDGVKAERGRSIGWILASSVTRTTRFLYRFLLSGFVSRGRP